MDLPRRGRSTALSSALWEPRRFTRCPESGYFCYMQEVPLPCTTKAWLENCELTALLLHTGKLNPGRLCETHLRRFWRSTILSKQLGSNSATSPKPDSWNRIETSRGFALLIATYGKLLPYGGNTRQIRPTGKPERVSTRSCEHQPTARQRRSEPGAADNAEEISAGFGRQSGLENSDRNLMQDGR